METFQALLAHLKQADCANSLFTGAVPWVFPFWQQKHHRPVLARSARIQEAQAAHSNLAVLAPSACRQELALLTPQAGETHQSSLDYHSCWSMDGEGQCHPQAWHPQLFSLSLTLSLPGMAWHGSRARAMLFSPVGRDSCAFPVRTERLQSWLLCQG